MLKWHKKLNEKHRIAFGRYVAKYFSNWKGTLSCCQRGSKNQCCSQKERNKANWPFISAGALIYAFALGFHQDPAPKHINRHAYTHKALLKPSCSEQRMQQPLSNNSAAARSANTQPKIIAKTVFYNKQILPTVPEDTVQDYRLK